MPGKVQRFGFPVSRSSRYWQYSAVMGVEAYDIAHLGLEDARIEKNQSTDGRNRQSNLVIPISRPGRN
jgi:hypothetical protein